MESSEESRSSSIRDYFDLLRWHRQGGNVEPSQKDIENNSKIQTIKIHIDFVQDAIAKAEQLVSKAEAELKEVDFHIATINRELLSLEEQLQDYHRHDLQLEIQLAAKPLVPFFATTEGTIPRLSLSATISTFFRAVHSDLRAFAFRLKDYILKKFGYPKQEDWVLLLVIVTPALPICFFPILANYIVIPFLFFYIPIRIFSIYRQHRQNWSNYF